MSFPENIMIVEDEKVTQRFIKDILIQNQVKNIECYEAAEDVLHRIQKQNFDMILMDIHIDGSMNGIELAKEILQITDLPIVFISENRDVDVLERVLSLSPYGFVFNPFSSKDIEFSLRLAYKNYISQMQQCKKTEPCSIVTINDTYSYDTDTQKLYADHQIIHLNTQQTRAIEMLCKNIDSMVTSEALSYAIWGENRTKGSTLRTLIYRIRKLLPDIPLVSYSKVGYALQSTR